MPELTPQERNDEILKRFPDTFGGRITEARNRGWDEDKIFSNVQGAFQKIPAPPQEPSTVPPQEPAAFTGEMIIEEPLETPLNTPDITATVGGVAGFAVAGPAGSIVGAALGGSFGEAMQQIAQQIMDSPDAPTTSKEASLRILKEGTIQGAFDLAGGALAGIFQKVARPFGKRLIEGFGPLNEFFQQFGSRFTPAQATDNSVVDMMENIAEGSLFGAQPIKDFKVAQQDSVEAMIDTLSDSIGTRLSREDLGQVVSDVIDKNSKIFRRQADVLYGTVDRLTEDAVVSMRGFKRLAAQKLKAAAARKGIGASAAGDTLLNKATQIDDFISFKEAQAIRSGLLDEKAALAITKDKAVGLTNELIKASDSAISKGAKRLKGNESALKAFREANKFWKQGKESFSNQFIHSLIKKDPEFMGKAIIGPGKITSVRRIKKIVDPETFDLVRSGWLEDAIRASVNVEGDFLGESFLKQLSGLEKDTLDILFSKAEQETMNKIGKTAQIIQKRLGGGGDVLVKLVQGSAIVGTVATGFAPGAGVILLGPAAISRIFTSKNKLLSKWFLEGFTIPLGSRRAIVLAEQLMRGIAEEGITKDVTLTSEPLEAPSKPAGISAQ